MKKLSILLSTYNGEKYLKEQIESILKQDFSDIMLYIRDDGSTDSTIEIIQEYVSLYSNIHILKKDKNIGAAMSFMTLLQYVNSDYYMFCDQDDVWLENKVSKSIAKIIELEELEKKSVLVFTNAKVVDEELNIIDSSFWNYNKVSPKILLADPKLINVFNCSPGCTMIFNDELKKKLTNYDENILMHDWYIMIQALQNGKVDFINDSLILYRQHSHNTIGADKISAGKILQKLFSFPKTVKEQIKTFKFVKKYTNINLFEYYRLKVKFNIIRLNKYLK
ncbi:MULTISPECIES: glycosyltransferase family 2 protein [Chryseobacterium]|jgi:rhamnosyltransferase|uniref:Glycosyltransferase 2-like domain-containing protein n=1 Tax=Chryseobacterium aquaticum TaxID=452084 RepID=A0A0Q3HY78_9FLAO|nr:MULTISPECIES: glycosyltransferase family 2 protein [Chryseobacterium]KQK27517.1 hypothetical protein AR438_00250 [Chryseobacterium aquaticum]